MGSRRERGCLWAAAVAAVLPKRISCTNVAVERHPDAPGVDQLGSVRPGPAELDVAVTEDDGAVVNPGEPFDVLGRRLLGEAVVVPSRTAVDVKDAVQLGRGLERVEPPLVGAETRFDARDLLRHVWAVPGRLAQPALAGPAYPGRLRQRTQALDRLRGPR